MLDLQMPGLSGSDVQRALNRADAQVPVIIITAHDAPTAREECMRDGAIAYLCKPLDERTLLRRLRAGARHASLMDHGPGRHEGSGRLAC